MAAPRRAPRSGGAGVFGRAGRRPGRTAIGSRSFGRVAYLLAVFGGLTLAPGAMLALALPVVLGSDHLADLLIGALAIVVGLGSVVAASSVLSGQAADDAAAFSIWMFVVGPLASVVFATIRDYWQHRGRRQG